jgi:hypothetical protein
LDIGESRQALPVVIPPNFYRPIGEKMKKIAYILSAAALSLAWMYAFMFIIRFFFNV